MKALQVMVTALIFASVTASAATPTKISDKEVQQLAKSQNIGPIWQHSVEYGSTDDTDMYVFMYTRPRPVLKEFCAAREVGLGVKINHGKPEVIHVQNADQLAPRGCNGAVLDDFVRVDNKEPETSLDEIAKLLRDGLPAMGGSPANVDYRDSKLKPYFDAASTDELSHFLVHSDNTVSALFFVKEISPSLLDIALKRNSDDSVHVVVDLDHLNDPVWK